MSPDGVDSARTDVLLEVALQLGATLDLGVLVPRVLDRVLALLDAERALFALIDGQGRIERAVTHNLDWKGPGHPLPISTSVLAEVLRERDLAVRESLGGPDARSGSLRLHGIDFIVAMPIHVRDRVAGVLYVDSRVPRLRDVNRKVETLRALAGLVGAAVENAWLFEELRFRTTLLAQLVHDFQAPLEIIAARSTVLTGPVVTDGAVRECAGDIVASAHRMVRMIDRSLKLSRIDAGASRDRPVAVNLGAVLRADAGALALVARPLEVEFQIQLPEGLPPAMVVPDRLDIVLDNLLLNALKYAAPGTRVTLSVARRDDPGPAEARARPEGEAALLFQHVVDLAPDPAAGFLEVSVHNDGEPISADRQQVLFASRGRGDGGRSPFSTGLGLAVIDQCARSLGGCVWARSAPGEGTRFSFTLPIRLLAAQDDDEPDGGAP